MPEGAGTLHHYRGPIYYSTSHTASKTCGKFHSRGQGIVDTEGIAVENVNGYTIQTLGCKRQDVRNTCWDSLVAMLLAWRVTDSAAHSLWLQSSIEFIYEES